MTRFYFKKAVSLKDRTKLKRFIGFIFKEERVKMGEITYVFCSDNYLLKINKDFLNHNCYTDIITFDMSSSQLSSKNGEIYISVDRVKDNASIHAVTKTQELHRVIFHGILHLCGYRDKTNIEKTKMREKENYFLNKYKNSKFHMES